MDAIRRADAFAIAQGISGWDLMKAAGSAVADAIRTGWSRRPVLVLCGPGNNGGDGFVASQILKEAGWPVRVAFLGEVDRLTGDAARGFRFWEGPVEALGGEPLPEDGLIIDALFGAGLSRPLEGAAMKVCVALNGASRPVIAIDVPSGVDGDGGVSSSCAIKAAMTITFHRLKPAHILEPTASMCGEIVLADIGIPNGWREGGEVVCELNGPALWPDVGTAPNSGAHKHQRGRLAVLSGGPSASGAARLSALAGLRTGAGLVTLLSPKNALMINAQSSTEVMVRGFGSVDEFLASMDAVRATAVVLGPGGGVGDVMRERVIAALSRSPALVLDADALTSFADDPGHLFAHLRPGDVLTPHAGEFERLFPKRLENSANKIEVVRAAAKLAGCVVVLKGPDTVIAAPGGSVRVNRHASPVLATAGTGDVLAGMIGAFLAQGINAFDAASAAVWLHGDVGLRVGQGMIAGDLVGAIPAALQNLDRRRTIATARAALE